MRRVKGSERHSCLPKKGSMGDEEFEEWWFDGGDECALETFNPTKKDIEKQPSWKLKQNKEDAIVEACWERAYEHAVKRSRRSR